MSQRYQLSQTFRYDYSAPVRRLRHRLMVVPPALHGDQRRVHHGVRIDGTRALTRSGRDAFGNHVLHVEAAKVDRAIEFAAWVEVERGSDAAPATLAPSALRDPRYAAQSRLTRTSDALVDVAAELRSRSYRSMELAESITSWVHGVLRYSHDVTNVQTTAAEALDAGAGVCQDYAHIMLSVSRACGLPARYVSGHLVGEGGTHAWVEVLLEDRIGSGRVLAVAFDPTHGRSVGHGYLTVAVGRDYADVAPTSGTFQSPGRGRLTCRKRLELADARTVPTPALVLTP